MKKSVFEDEAYMGSEAEIIKQIHKRRFNQNNPYVITGGHFRQLFVRNLGIFYNALLDPRIPAADEDWYNRQAIALKTLQLDLEVFRLANREFTTIIPLTPIRYTALNIYSRPSDSLFAIVSTLRSLIDPTYIPNLFPAHHPLSQQPLQTIDAGGKLLKQYTPLLNSLLQDYYNTLIDPKNHLIRPRLSLSSARDGIKRSSSFYDNVIAWATISLAARLGFFSLSPQTLAVWKQRILTNFWLERDGIFLDDMSRQSFTYKLFSADMFIVTSTGFLSLHNPTDRVFLERMVAYVQTHALDHPFPLQYSQSVPSNKLHHPVRLFAGEYMGTSIWSHWGMEYIKTLLLLALYDKAYLLQAQRHLTAYKKNIERYGGYPELYHKNGSIFATRAYKSVLHAGWVINYEQAKMMAASFI